MPGTRCRGRKIEDGAGCYPYASGARPHGFSSHLPLAGRITSAVPAGFLQPSSKLLSACDAAAIPGHTPDLQRCQHPDCSCWAYPALTEPFGRGRIVLFSDFHRAASMMALPEQGRLSLSPLRGTGSTDPRLPAARGFRLYPCPAWACARHARVIVLPVFPGCLPDQAPESSGCAGLSPHGAPARNVSLGRVEIKRPVTLWLPVIIDARSAGCCGRPIFRPWRRGSHI